MEVRDLDRDLDRGLDRDLDRQLATARQVFDVLKAAGWRLALVDDMQQLLDIYDPDSGLRPV